MGLMGTLAKVAIGYAAARGIDRASGGQGLGALLGGGAQVKGSHPLSAQQAQMGKALSGQAPDMAAANPMGGMMDMLQNSGLGALMGGAGGAAGGSNPMADMMEKLQGGMGGMGGMPDLSALTGSSGGEGGGLLSQLGGSGGAGLAGMLAALGGTAAATQGQGAGALIDQFRTAETAPDKKKKNKKKK